MELTDGDELELRLQGGRWVRAEWRHGAPWLTLGGEWEERPDAEPVQARLADVDLSRVELRRAASPVQATRVVALSHFLEAQARDVQPGDPIDVNLVRANKEYAVELPRAIERYQAQLRDHSFDLLNAAAQYGATRNAAGDLDAARTQLEEAAAKFEETSRWLVALQVMQSEQG
jgi:hypothetical protein